MVEMYDSLIVYYHLLRLFFLRLNYFLPQTSSFVCSPPLKFMTNFYISPPDSFKLRNPDSQSPRNLSSEMRPRQRPECRTFEATRGLVPRPPEESCHHTTTSCLPRPRALRGARAILPSLSKSAVLSLGIFLLSLCRGVPCCVYTRRRLHSASEEDGHGEWMLNSSTGIAAPARGVLDPRPDVRLQFLFYLLVIYSSISSLPPPRTMNCTKQGT